MSIEPPIFSRFADLYDAAYAARGKDYAAEAEAVLAIAGSEGAAVRRVLDAGCGSGAHLERFVALGMQATGIDASGAMVDQARRRVPGAAFHVADMRTALLPERFDLVACLFAAIGYLPDRAGLAAAIARFAEMLRAGGAIVVEPALFPFQLAPPARDVLDFECRGHRWRRIATAEVVHDAEGTLLRIRFEFVPIDARAEPFVETHPIRLFTPEDYARAFAAVGLTAELAPAPPFPRGLLVARS